MSDAPPRIEHETGRIGSCTAATFTAPASTRGSTGEIVRDIGEMHGRTVRMQMRTVRMQMRTVPMQMRTVPMHARVA